MGRKRQRRRVPRAPELSIEQIFAWADAHYRRMGAWPRKTTGWVFGSLGEKWSRIDQALQRGHRGLAGHSSLPRLLAEKRGVRNHMNLPPLTTAQILTWADGHHSRTGRWPRAASGP